MSMELLRPERLIRNMENIAGRFYDLSTNGMFTDLFWNRISTLQNTSAIFHNDRFEFENHKNFPPLSILGLISEASHLSKIGEDQREMVIENMASLAAKHPDLERAIHLSTPRNAFISCPRLPAMSGSSFSAIGFSFINLDSLNGGELTNLMIHESVHNAINIEDICEGIFTDRQVVESREYYFLSSIRRIERRFDYSFHALMVDIALYQHDMTTTSRPEQDRARNISLCLDAARRTQDRSLADGAPLLTANGCDLLELVAASWRTASH